MEQVVDEKLKSNLEWPKFVSKLYLLIEENLPNDTVTDRFVIDGGRGFTGGRYMALGLHLKQVVRIYKVQPFQTRLSKNGSNINGICTI